jgi:hypothetical protein
MDNTWELLNIVERTIDSAFQGKQMLNMYEYLKSIKATKRDATEFIDSSVAREIQLLVMDLEDYLREGYGHLGKPEARKIKDYLYSILEDAWKYEQEKRPGRRRKASK